MENEVSGVIHAVRNGPGDREQAESLLKAATAMEAALDAPSGPPEPIKPSFEVYGELLAGQGRAKEAAAQFEQALARMPNRRASVQALQRLTPAGTSQAR
jgi:predicted negative regulator of RcsB-dependent stress response